MGKYYIGIDIGGTNLKAGLVSDTGALLATAKTPLVWENEAEFVRTLAALSRKAAEKAGVPESEIAAVGMGVPGEVDPRGGRIVYTPNIPISDFSIEKSFRTDLDVPVYLGNDANCAALGEYHAGAGKGVRNLIVVTLGTGVGAGILLDGKLMTGANGAAGEAGHMVIEAGGVPCPCGRRGCWEQYSSAPALRRMTCEAMQAHPESALWRRCGGDLSRIGGRSAFQEARESGDETARAVCERYVHYLALGITNLINLFQPDMLCIGGGVSNEADEALLYPVQKLVERERYGSSRNSGLRVVKAQLGNDAGIIGAAFLAVE